MLKQNEKFIDDAVRGPDPNLWQEHGKKIISVLLCSAAMLAAQIVRRHINPPDSTLILSGFFIFYVSVIKR